ncbi:RS4-like protein [Mya arenaria]|uniref:40S ribosomal protein S4 n=1 Tax=Mya arenaria TaxID=6604 RepID=A0ABY7EHE7_MYAAR|nr:RS4-like protein [Mya arenaria]
MLAPGYRGRRKHLKRLTAPKAWMLDKLGGVFAPKPGTGPHRSRECLPLVVFLRNRLKYALTADEVKKIVKQRLIKIDGKVRTETRYPAGFMGKNIETILLYKLCRIRKQENGPKGVPYVTTTDGRTIRYPDPLIKVNDTAMVDIASGKIKDFIKFDSGNLCMITGGHNLGRVGVIQHRDRHPGSFDIVTVKDAVGHTFATRIGYVFVIGKGSKPWVSLPRGKGVKLTIAEERDRRMAIKSQ